MAILISLAFWGWLWGLAGMLIAVPLLIVMKAICEHFDELKGIAEFLSRAARVHHEPEAEPAQAKGATGKAAE